MNNELERMWKEAVVVYLKVMPGYSPGVLRKSTKASAMAEMCTIHKVAQKQVNWLVKCTRKNVNVFFNAY
jgi:hypothetical protein